MREMSKASEALRASRPEDRREASRSPLALAFAASILLHALLVALPRGPGGEAAATAPPLLVARLLPPPEPPASPVKTPPSPPPVIKNTLDPPNAQVLADPIKPQPRRRITDKPEPQPPETAAIKPPPTPTRAAPPQEEPTQSVAPVPPIAAREEGPRRSLDLSVPADPRERQAERLSTQELNETLTRLSETMLYPSEALRRGLEGEVVIMVELGAAGRILDAGIASGSGHPVLDEAAVRAVRRLGTLGPSTANRTILLPVRFKIL